jgi:hypothetical protein
MRRTAELVQQRARPAVRVSGHGPDSVSVAKAHRGNREAEASFVVPFEAGGGEAAKSATRPAGKGESREQGHVEIVHRDLDRIAGIQATTFLRTSLVGDGVLGHASSLS